eukprot:scaffold4938_cov18-Tisochrysis_lutea.AAC.1
MLKTGACEAVSAPAFNSNKPSDACINGSLRLKPEMSMQVGVLEHWPLFLDVWCARAALGICDLSE